MTAVPEIILGLKKKKTILWSSDQNETMFFLIV
jgi:hypothetical protein